MIGRFLEQAPLDLFADVRGADGILRQHEYQSLGTADRPNNRIGIQRTGLDVTGRKPAGDSVLLKRLDEGSGDGRVRRRVADEHIRWVRGRMRAVGGSLRIFWLGAVGH